jgi:hypothetical protein
VHESREAGGTEAKRLGAVPPKRTRAGVQLADVAQNIRNELDVAKQLSGTPEAQLAIGRTVGVVKDGAWGVSVRDSAQISDRLCLPETAFDGTDDGAAESQQRSYLVRPQQSLRQDAPVANARELRRDSATRVRVGP